MLVYISGTFPFGYPTFPFDFRGSQDGSSQGSSTRCIGVIHFFHPPSGRQVDSHEKKTASWVGWWWELKYYSVFIGKYFISHEARNFYTTRIQWKVRVGIFWILQLQNLPNFWSVTSNIGDYERV